MEKCIGVLEEDGPLSWECPEPSQKLTTNLYVQQSISGYIPYVGCFTHWALFLPLDGLFVTAAMSNCFP